MTKDYSVEVGLPGDTRLTVQMLVEEVKSQLGKNGRKGQGKVAAEIAEVSSTRGWPSGTALLNSDEVPSQYLPRDRRAGGARRRPENSVSSRTTRVRRATPSCPSLPPPSTSYIGWGKTTHLGYGIPLMIGAKLARPRSSA